MLKESLGMDFVLTESGEFILDRATAESYFAARYARLRSLADSLIVKDFSGGNDAILFAMKDILSCNDGPFVCDGGCRIQGLADWLRRQCPDYKKPSHFRIVKLFDYHF